MWDGHSDFQIGLDARWRSIRSSVGIGFSALLLAIASLPLLANAQGRPDIDRITARQFVY